MQGPSALLNVITVPPGATITSPRLVIDGVRGAIFVYQSGGPVGALIGSWAISAGTDPYGNTYPQGLNVSVGAISGGTISGVTITGSTINGTTFNGTDFTINANGAFFYSGTPAANNLIASIAAVAGTDPFGNNYLSGFAAYTVTGSLVTATAIQAGQINNYYAVTFGSAYNNITNIQVNPNQLNSVFSAIGGSFMVAGTRWYAQDPTLGGGNAESWHDLRPLSNSFVGTITSRYPPQIRLSPDGFVDVVGFVQFPGTGTNFNSITWATVPTQFRPANNTGHKWPIVLETNVAPLGTSCVQIDTSGNFQFHNMPTSGLAGTIASIYGRYPLNGPIVS